MAQRVAWLYPESHPAFGRPVHLNIARNEHEDPNIGLSAHAFEEWDVEVPRMEPVTDEHGVVTEEDPDAKPGERKFRIKMQPSAHPDGISTAHEDKSLCGITRKSWVHPLPAPDGHTRCPDCEAKANA